MCKTRKVSNIRYKYHGQFMLSAAVYMKQNQNTIATINHQCTIQIKLHDHSWFFHQSLKKLAIVGRLFSQLRTRFSGHCHCGGVAILERF